MGRALKLRLQACYNSSQCVHNSRSQPSESVYKYNWIECVNVSKNAKYLHMVQRSPEIDKCDNHNEKKYKIGIWKKKIKYVYIISQKYFSCFKKKRFVLLLVPQIVLLMTVSFPELILSWFNCGIIWDIVANVNCGILRRSRERAGGGGSPRPHQVISMGIKQGAGRLKIKPNCEQTLG